MVGKQSVVPYFAHPLMDSIILRTFDQENPILKPCSEDEIFKPDRDTSYYSHLHESGRYAKYANAQNEYPMLGTTAGFAALAYYNETYQAKKARTTGVLGWNLVGTNIPGNNLTIIEGDTVSLFQSPSNLECILAFRGTDDKWDILNDCNIAGSNFCGFENVHQGFVNEIKALSTRAVHENIFPLLPMCAKVYATGHSLGGAVAELFTACANRAIAPDADGYNDHSKVAWTWGTPTLLPALG